MVRPRILSGLALLLVTSACSDTSEPSLDARFGRYQLLRVNGKPLPAFVVDGNAARIDFLRGAIHLEADGTFVDSTDQKVSPHSGTPYLNTDVASGTYRVSGDTVFFDSVRRHEKYFMVHLTEQSLQQELVGNILLYTR